MAAWEMRWWRGDRLVAICSDRCSLHHLMHLRVVVIYSLVTKLPQNLLVSKPFFNDHGFCGLRIHTRQGGPISVP